MRNSLLIFFLLLNVSARSQTGLTVSSHFMKDTTQSFEVRLSGNYFFASDAITNELATDYYLHKFISDDHKDVITKNLSSGNRYGAEAGYEAALTFHPDTSNKKVEGFIAFRNRLFSGANFSRDFFELFFRGNKMYAGKTADLSDFSFSQFTYRQFVFGIGNRFNIPGNGKLYVAADLAINQGIKFLRIDGGHATIFTDAEGEYIDADLHASVFTDDSSAQHPSKLDGSGYSGDLYIEYETETGSLAFSVENYGSIQWNKWSTTISLDTLVHFEGIDVRDLFDFQDSIRVSGANLDSVFYKNYVTNRKEERITTQLPMKISGSYTHFLCNKRLSATIGMDVMLNSPALNRYFAIVKYSLGRSNQFGIAGAAGGYTDFQAGISYMHVFPWRLKVEIGSHYVYPMVTWNSGKSQGAYLSLSKSF